MNEIESKHCEEFDSVFGACSMQSIAIIQKLLIFSLLNRKKMTKTDHNQSKLNRSSGPKVNN